MLGEVCRYVIDDRPRRDELYRWLEKHFSLTTGSADFRTLFLIKVGLLNEHGGVCSVAEPTHQWLETDDSTIIIAQIHSRTQFIGEMLREVKFAQDTQNPLHTWDLLTVANGGYGIEQPRRQ